MAGEQLGLDGFETASAAAPERGLTDGGAPPPTGTGQIQERISAHPFPLRRSKIDRPSLPESTLRRDRLLNWLDVKIHRRVVFVVAEAGFGKTTLLADFARRTRLRTVWYRLDEDDTDGLVFLRYLVAACRTVDATLLPRTAALLEDDAGTITAEAAVHALISELDCLGSEPSIVVLDDYHVAETVPAIRAIVERLIARAPERLTFVFLARRAPILAVARLRARDELAELTRDDLRFDATDTERLFRDAYHQPLEPDVLRDLQRRTDGWAASLQLVKAAVGERTPEQIRAFVRSLSGAEGELYDYLAEEVVADLDPRLQSFLMHVALLDEIDAELASVAASVTPAEARELLTESQRLGFVSRPSRGAGPAGLHLLVRQFLLARLEAEMGHQAVIELHRHIAASLESRSWRLAANHWAAAGDAEEVRRVIVAATPTIIGNGDYAAAHDLITRYPDPNPNPWFDIILTRVRAAEGRYREAWTVAERAFHAASCDQDQPALRELAALNAAYAAAGVGDGDFVTRATDIVLSGEPTSAITAAMAESLQQLVATASVGSLDSCRASYVRMLELSRSGRHARYEAIALMNLAMIDRLRYSMETALAEAEAAVSLAEAGASGSDESIGAHLNLALIVAHSGEWDRVSGLLAWAGLSKTGWVDDMFPAEMAEIELLYGRRSEAERYLKLLPPIEHSAELGTRLLSEARAAMMDGEFAVALEKLSHAEAQRPFMAGYEASILLLRAQVSCLAEDPDAVVLADAAVAHADSQQAWYLSKLGRLATAAAESSQALSAFIEACPLRDRPLLSVSAEIVLTRFAGLTEAAAGIVASEAERCPRRWQEPLRQRLRLRGSKELESAHLLEAVGEATDVPLLRTLAAASPQGSHHRNLGRALVRRVAPRIYVEDLGRVFVRVGSRVVAGTDLRRRVLSLLVYLLTRPQFSATRDSVLDAIWPDQDPETAANSLNQTAYFLRRIFEPEYSESSSAGYLRHENELVWLDPELVRSRSSECRELLDDIQAGDTVDAVEHLGEHYLGRFALDFSYDDWAVSFRDCLHAAYLRVMETSITADTHSGNFLRAITLAQRAIAVDPEADQIEVSLLRLYRLTGAHAAAAEQYAHYSTVLREQLGIEAPPLDAL